MLILQVKMRILFLFVVYFQRFVKNKALFDSRMALEKDLLNSKKIIQKKIN